MRELYALEKEGSKFEPKWKEFVGIFKAGKIDEQKLELVLYDFGKILEGSGNDQMWLALVEYQELILGKTGNFMDAKGCSLDLNITLANFDKLRALYLIMCEKYLQSTLKALYQTIGPNAGTFWANFLEINLGNWLSQMSKADFLDEYLSRNTKTKKHDTKKDESIKLLLKTPLFTRNLISLMEKFIIHRDTLNISSDTQNVFIDFVGRNLSSLSEQLKKTPKPCTVLNSEINAYNQTFASTTPTRLAFISTANLLNTWESKNFLMNYFKYIGTLFPSSDSLEKLDLDSVFLTPKDFSYESIFYLNALIQTDYPKNLELLCSNYHQFMDCFLLLLNN